MLDTVTRRESTPAGDAGAANGPRPKVLHVLLSLECGGMEQVVVDLIRLGRAAGFQSEVVCLARRGELAEQLAAEGVPVHCVFKPEKFSLKVRDDLAKVLDAVRPDIIHTHHFGSLFYIGPPARKRGVRAIIHTEHGKEDYGRWQYRWIGRLAARHAKAFCCVSEDIARHVLRNRIVSQRKIQLVSNGIELDRFQASDESRRAIRHTLGIATDAVVFGTVGRLSDIKRQDVMIEGFAELRKVQPESHLLLVGDGPERSALERLVADRDLGRSVHFAGYQENAERYLTAIDVFTLTSDSEGTPLSLLEAWSTGLPVVVTAVGGLPELVEDGTDGLLVPARDPSALAKAFAALCANAPLRRRMGEVGARKVRTQFDRRTMAANYARLYGNLLEPPVGRNTSLGALKKQ
jgi:sugar transferase (PEP-CTERM/EpsH1 system associated)